MAPLDQSVKFSLYLQRMPILFPKNTGLISLLKSTDVLWSLIIMAPVLYTVGNILLEKRSGIKVRELYFCRLL